MNRDILIKWIEECLKCEMGESLFIPTSTKHHSQELEKAFKKELKILAEIDAVKASQVVVLRTFQDRGYWVELKKTYGSPLVGFKKNKKGETVRMFLKDPDRTRRLLCMKEDGFSVEEIELAEGELTKKERRLLENGGS